MATTIGDQLDREVDHFSDDPLEGLRASPPSRTRKLTVRGVVGVVFLSAFVGSLLAFKSVFSKQGQAPILYTVTQKDLLIKVSETGNLESQLKTDIVCELEDLGLEGGDRAGAQILFIVPNGTSVKKGDLLVKLNDAPIRTRRDDQELVNERALSEQKQSGSRFENQKSQNTTSESEAKLRLEIAELALKQYTDETAGTHVIRLQEVNRAIQEAESKRLVEVKNQAGVKTLYDLGYRSKGQLEQAHISAQSAENELARQLAAREELVIFVNPKTTLELKGAVESAKQALLQTELNNQSLLSQAEAAKHAAEQVLKKEIEKLDKFQEQLSKCLIHAPHDGMAVYAVEDSFEMDTKSKIREGASVREQQKLITLPDLSKMQVKTAIHESELSRVSAGMAVEIKLDAFPDRMYSGRVKSVATLPGQSGFSGFENKVYETLIVIEGEVRDLRPGMTAIVEIQAQRVEDVLTVPVHAVVQSHGENFCYVFDDGKAERRAVSLGLSNDTAVVIRDGLRRGERIQLNPEAYAHETRQRPAADDGDGIVEKDPSSLDDEQQEFGELTEDPESSEDFGDLPGNS